MPGVLSARWSGRHGADEENLRLVLAQVADVPAHRRGAHFACAAALVLPSGFSHVEEGAVHGTLTEAPRGTNGFGYDPVFLPAAVPGVPAGLTTAELSSADKDAISHRGQALRRLVPVIADMVR
jgi:XTP/dITP diphosphohydrolase